MINGYIIIMMSRSGNDFYDLGKQKDHWAKEVVNITHTREAKTNLKLCEKKISHFKTACFDANNIITQNMKELSSNKKLKSATVVASKIHDLLLDYIKESTQGLSKMSINRIRRALWRKTNGMLLRHLKMLHQNNKKFMPKPFVNQLLKAYQKKKRNLRYGSCTYNI